PPVVSSTASTGSTQASSTAAASAVAAPAPVSGKLLLLLEADDNQRKVWQQVVDAFHKAGHKPPVDLANPSSIYTKFDTMIAGGAGPDLFAGFETKQLPHYAGAGAALNMDPYMGRSTTIKPASFFAYTWSKHVINGHLSAMPTNNAMLALFYNVDLFKAAGVTPPPKQWGAKGWDAATFLDTAHKLTTTSGGKQQWFSSWSTWWVYVLPWVWANGGHLFDASISKVLVDAPEVVSSFQWLADLTWKEHVQPTPAETTTAKPSFVNGTLAIQGTTENSAPGYLQTIKSFQWDVGVMPTGTAGVWTRDPSNSAIAWSGTKQPDATWELAEYMGGDEAQLIIGLGGNGVPARISAARSPKFLKQPNGVDWQVFVDGIDHEGIQPITDNFPDVDSTITKQTAPLWSNQQTAQQVMTTLKPLLEQHLSAAKFRRDRTGLWQDRGWATTTS
ncbi:MAG TPA: extracellular solute-binding protein, partial [Chloroflexota bacterium]|nr:extracellular solute-binding protein [Chloroflexota bacterium]